MWPKKFHFFKAFFKNFSQYLLLNTIKFKSKEDGFTFTELSKEYEDLPKTRIYRQLKKLEENGLLVRNEESPGTTGRPKHVFKLSTEGTSRLEYLRDELTSFFEIMKRQFPDPVDAEIDPRQFLDNLTFLSFINPIQHIMHRNIPIQKKRELLKEIEASLLSKYNEVQEVIKKLEEKEGEN